MKYCYGSINDEGYIDSINCYNYLADSVKGNMVELELSSERDELWFLLRYYDVKTGEWGEKHVFPEPEPEPNPWEEEMNQLKLAMAEIAEAHEQEKTEMQLALAELAELVGG